jgi:hypothetical protein
MARLHIALGAFAVLSGCGGKIADDPKAQEVAPTASEQQWVYATLFGREDGAAMGMDLTKDFPLLAGPDANGDYSHVDRDSLERDGACEIFTRFHQQPSRFVSKSALSAHANTDLIWDVPAASAIAFGLAHDFYKGGDRVFLSLSEASTSVNGEIVTATPLTFEEPQSEPAGSKPDGNPRCNVVRVARGEPLRFRWRGADRQSAGVRIVAMNGSDPIVLRCSGDGGELDVPASLIDRIFASGGNDVRIRYGAETRVVSSEGGTSLELASVTGFREACLEVR